ncbi:MAG: HAD family hydrolase [Dorea sp.]
MNIRMIGFDLDGTLLTTDKILTERTKKALEAAADRGVDSGTGDGTAVMWTSERTFSASVHKICSDS